MALILVDTERLLERMMSLQNYADKARGETADGIRLGEASCKDAHIAEGISRGMNDVAAAVAQYLLNIMEGLDPSTEA